MADQITEIFLPGRTIGSPAQGARGDASGVMLPSFVAGPENRLVATAVGALLGGGAASEQDDVSIAPSVLALYGPSGSGKTHLARGLVGYWHDRFGSESAEYVTASDFRREFVAAIDADAVREFRQRVRGRALFAIDDLHQLPDDAYLLQELRYTLDEYEETGGTVVITSTQPASALSNMPRDLQSRMSRGLVLQLTLPGEAARERIVRQLAAALGHPLGDDVANRLAGGVRGTANELLGAVFELCANSHSSRGDTSEADRVLANRAVRQPALREIVAVVAKYYRQPQAVLKSGTRRQSAVLPRAVIIYLARELAGYTYDQIGRALGGRDHTTVMHSYRKIEHDRQHDLGIQAALDELRQILLGR